MKIGGKDLMACTTVSAMRRRGGHGGDGGGGAGAARATVLVSSTAAASARAFAFRANMRRHEATMKNTGMNPTRSNLPR
uniref:Uncharacterized protein n=1 Tax=Leersia perrieri TaxID=77586 RepID=A0A0D9VQQ7_9ORYZ